MAISMAKTVKEERLRWVLPVVRGEIKLNDIMRACPYGKRSVERWIAAYRKGKDEGLVPKSTAPNTSPEETPIWIKEKVVAKRKKLRLCALKLHWICKEEGLHIPIRTIGKILKQEGLTRRYRVKRVKYSYIKAERRPGDLIEIDVKYVPGKLANKRYFQYTAIDAASRWRYLQIFEEQSGYHSVLFLQEVMRRFSYPVRAVKTDNGFIFTNRYTGTYKREDLSPVRLHGFDAFCAKHDIIHYLIDPGHPAQNGTVERSHREDQEKFYNQNTFRDILDLKRKIRRWNIYYNNLLHCGLNGKSPMRYLEEYAKVNPPNVVA